jgi:hypothetical protein
MLLHTRGSRYKAAQGFTRRGAAALEMVQWVGAILGADEDVVVSVTQH